MAPKFNMDHPPLDVDRILRETFVARVECHATLGSTNDRARECARHTGLDLPLLVVAEAQTAGRGRGGRRWWTGRGSLAMSLLLEPGHGAATEAGQSPLVALAAAVAVAETVAPLVGSHPSGIEWPNDVTAGGRKLAGVLVEVLPDGRRVVGIGVNTNNSLAEAPAELRDTATALLELTGTRHDQTTILVGLLRHLEERLAELASDPKGIAARADALCVQRGELVELDTGGRVVAGRCAGIAPDGALLLETREGRQAFYAGMLRRQGPVAAER
jgi:BirA family biotin operon repressor/biotin-[acetyl-CoA-carboxylase] ligase